MFFFEGEKCPVCGRDFEYSDDIVSCPDCGAPCHRECYKDNGGCAYADRHAEGYTWTRTKVLEETKVERKCPTCGRENAPGRLYCENCSAPLYDRENSRREGDDPTEPRGDGYYSFGGTTFTISDGELIKGVPVGDVKRYVGSSWFYYVPVFYGFARKLRSFSFNLIAFLMHGLWFFSRRMYAIGIALLSLELGAQAYQAYSYDTILPYYTRMAAGETNAVFDLLRDQPYMTMALMAAAVIRYGIMFFSGLAANRIYMNRSVRRIKRINRASRSADEFNTALESKGGVAFWESFICAIIYFAAQYYIVNTLFK